MASVAPTKVRDVTVHLLERSGFGITLCDRELRFSEGTIYLTVKELIWKDGALLGCKPHTIQRYRESICEECAKHPDYPLMVLAWEDLP